MDFAIPMQHYYAPSEANQYLAEHVNRLLASYKRRLGSELIALCPNAALTAQAVFLATFALVSHDTSADPVFNYANQTALRLFEMTWEEFTRLPSRISAEPVHRQERERLLHRVAQAGFIDDYEGIRISKSGKRFMICNAVVWNVDDDNGKPFGQAAMFHSWRMLSQSE